jgi:hypothetical protein
MRPTSTIPRALAAAATAAPRAQPRATPAFTDLAQPVRKCSKATPASSPRPAFFRTHVVASGFGLV